MGTVMNLVLSESAPESWFWSMVKKGKKSPFAVVGKLTPELAAFLLTRNVREEIGREPEVNRKISQNTVERYAEMMKTGKWTLNGEGVIISDDGFLNTGQHRASAVVLAETTIDCFFSFGVSRDSRTTTDAGKTKTAGDRLEMLGLNYSAVLASVAVLIWQNERLGQIPRHSNSTHYRPSGPVLDDLAVVHQKTIIESACVVPRKGLKLLAPLSVFAFAHILLKTRNEAAATDFITKIVTGANLGQNDPIFVARERLIDDKQAKRYTPRRALETILRAWNMYRLGRSTTKIQIMDEWPKIHR